MKKSPQNNSALQRTTTPIIMPSMLISHFLWKILNSCNYACPDCQSRGQAQDNNFERGAAFQTALKILTVPAQSHIVEICGGEPCLHPFLSEIIHFLFNHSENVSVVLHTNGFRDLKWYARLMQSTAPDKLEFRLWPQPRDHDVKHLLLLAADIRKRGHKLRIELKEEVWKEFPNLRQAFSQSADKLSFSLGNGQNVIEAKSTRFGSKKKYGCPGLTSLEINSSGAARACAGMEWIGKWQADDFWQAQNCEGCAHPCQAPSFSDKDEARAFIDANRRERRYLMWKRAPVFSFVNAEIPPHEILRLRLGRTVGISPSMRFIDDFFAAATELGQIFASFQDKGSRNNFVAFLARQAEVSATVLPQMDCHNFCDYIAFISGREGKLRIFTDLRSKGDVNGKEISDASSVQEALALIYGKCVVLILDVAYPHNLSDIYPAIRDALLWYKPQIRIMFRDMRNDTIKFAAWSIANFEDYNWRAQANENWPEMLCFWGKTSQLPDAKTVVPSIIITSFSEAAADIIALKGLLADGDGLDIQILASKKTGETLKKICRLYPAARIVQYGLDISSQHHIDYAISMARNEYVLIVDSAMRIPDDFLKNYGDVQTAEADIIIGSSKGENSDANAIGKYMAGAFGEPASCIFVYRKAYIGENRLQHLPVEPLANALFALEALRGTDNILYVPSLSLSHTAVLWQNQESSGNESYLWRLATFAKRFAALVTSAPAIFAEKGKKTFIDAVMKTIWPLVQKELREAGWTNTIETLATQATFEIFTRVPEIPLWILEWVATKEAVAKPARPCGRLEKEKWLSQVAWVESGDFRKPGKAVEYKGAFARSVPSKPFFSILMPNFNKEDYLESALASVLDQSFDNFEILLVDDASTDESFEIAKDFADMDKRIRLWRMERNSLQGGCQNFALDKVRGDYFICVDSDDLLHGNFLERAFVDVTTKEADIFIYAARDIDEKGNTTRIYSAPDAEIEGRDFSTRLWAGEFPWGPWGKVYSIQFARENNIRFEEFNFHQDMFFLARWSQKSKKVISSKDVVYSVRLTPDSSIRPKKRRYAHLHSAITKMALRNEACLSDSTRYSWQDAASGQTWSFRERLVPAAAEAWRMFGAIPMATQDFALFVQSASSLRALFTYAASLEITQPSPENLISKKQSPIGKLNTPSLPPVILLAEAANIAREENCLADECEFLMRSGLFDAEWYISHDVTVGKTAMEAIKHYCSNWQPESWRNPAPWFNTGDYLNAYPDVARANINPFIHYIVNGYLEGRELQPIVKKNEIDTAYNSYFNSLYCYMPERPTVMLVEANTCHGETLPGYAHYLLELGYAVEVVITPAMAAADPFCRLNHPLLRRWSFPFHEIVALLQKAPHLDAYAAIFLNSFTFYNPVNGYERPSFRDHCPDIGITQHGVLAVVHEQDVYDNSILSPANCLTLAPLVDNMVMVNPHYFGDVKITAKNQASTHFIVVGAVNERERKNIDILVEAVRKLAQNGIHNFSITLIGRGQFYPPQDLAKYFQYLGELSFADMYPHMEDADFLLALLDPENPGHWAYLTAHSVYI